MFNSQKDLRKKLLGRKGERAVVAFMKKRGYKLVKSNYTTPFGEADAVMSKDGKVYFIEVKTRSNFLYGEPKDAVGYKKQEKYRKIAEYYMLKNGETEVEFVVAEVVGEEINLIFNAF